MNKHVTYRLLNCKSFRLLMIVLCISFRSAAQTEDYGVHANIIYHFTKYIDWPSEKKTGDFVIGILGESPLYDEMKDRIEGKMAGNQKIVVKRLTIQSVSNECHIVFISAEESEDIKRILAKIAGKPVLLVSESEGLAQQGSCINFRVVAEHLKLEINKKNIENRKLGIASELLQLGKIVK